MLQVTENTEDNPNIFRVWNEATAERNAKEVASTYWRVLKEYDNGVVKDIVIWVDNCAPQVRDLS